MKQTFRIKVDEQTLKSVARGSTVVVDVKIGEIVVEGKRSGKRQSVKIRSMGLQRGVLLIEVRK